MRRPGPIAAFVLLTACAAVPPAGVPVTGQWGGTHIGLMLGPDGGSIDYDCAAGRLDGPLIPDASGRFAVEGRHTPGTGGPEREGQVQPTYRARFTGAVRGETMSLTGRVENGVLLGPFTLRRGAEPGIFRCL